MFCLSDHQTMQTMVFKDQSTIPKATFIEIGVYWWMIGFLDRWTLRILHLSQLRDICHNLVQATRLSRCARYWRHSSWWHLLKSKTNMSASLCLLVAVHKSVSSAKSRMWDFRFTPISKMWMRNIKGPSTVPCGTPELTDTGADCSLVAKPSLNPLVDLSPVRSSGLAWVRGVGVAPYQSFSKV